MQTKKHGSNSPIDFIDPQCQEFMWNLTLTTLIDVVFKIFLNVFRIKSLKLSNWK